MDYGWLFDGAGRAMGSPGQGSRRSRRRLLTLVSAALLVVAACGGQPAASPSAAAASATPEASLTPEPTATPTPSPTPTASATNAAATCQPQAPTTLSQAWKSFTGQEGEYRYSLPADWSVQASTITIPTNVSVSPQTLAQTGASSDAKLKVDAAFSADNASHITAWVLKGVTSPIAQLFDNELAWLKTQPQVLAVIDETLAACIDGTPARGFSSTWTSPTAGGPNATLVIYMAQRNGKMYEIQLTTNDIAQSATLDEVLRTWKWTEPLASGTPTDVSDQLANTKFMTIGTSDTLDQSGDHPNTTTFKGVFPQATDRIYVLYELDDGVHDTVNFSWKRGGVEIAKATFAYSDKTSFAWTWINKNSSTGKFAPGNYELRATLKTTGDTVTIAFTVQ